MAVKRSSLLKRFFDKSEKYIYPNEEEYTFYQDGTILSINKEKVRILEYPDQSKEITYPDGKTFRLEINGEVNFIEE